MGKLDITFVGVRAKIVLGEDTFDASVTGVASYGNRTVSVSVPVNDDALEADVRAAVNRVIADRMDDIELEASRAAYQAREVALRGSEPLS
jgi:type IV secretory pathway ATPase VirB11/archaellum biosynthesis ATPase